MGADRYCFIKVEEVVYPSKVWMFVVQIEQGHDENYFLDEVMRDMALLSIPYEINNIYRVQFAITKQGDHNSCFIWGGEMQGSGSTYLKVKEIEEDVETRVVWEFFGERDTGCDIQI